MKSILENYGSVVVAFLSGVLLLSFVSWVSYHLGESKLLSGQMISLTKAILISSSFIMTVVFLRKMDQPITPDLGLSVFPKAMKSFFLGMGLILAPLAVTLGISSLVGWVSFEFNGSADLIRQHLIGVLIVLLLEAFPEELLMRGYVFGRLKVRLTERKSALVTVALFVLIPVLVYPLLTWVLEVPGSFAVTGGLSGSYLMYMLFFGALTIYLRIQTGSIWTGVGFHLVFVSMNRIIGLQDTSILIVKDAYSETPVQITLITCIVIVLAVVMYYPKWKSKKGSNQHLSSVSI